VDLAIDVAYTRLAVTGPDQDVVAFKKKPVGLRAEAVEQNGKLFGGERQRGWPEAGRSRVRTTTIDARRASQSVDVGLIESWCCRERKEHLGSGHASCTDSIKQLCWKRGEGGPGGLSRCFGTGVAGASKACGISRTTNSHTCLCLLTRSSIWSEEARTRFGCGLTYIRTEMGLFIWLC